MAVRETSFTEILHHHAHVTLKLMWFGDNIAGRLIGYDKEQIAEEKKGCFLEFKTAKDFWLQVSFINLQESPFFDFLNLT